MEFILLKTYTNYIDAHIARGVLEEAGINCWLKDENTVTIDPVLAYAVGGIKVMVVKEQAARASVLLEDLRKESKKKTACPQCGSTNIELVSTPRKARNWLSALITFFLGEYAITVDRVYHCFDCGKEYTDVKQDDTV